MCLKTGSDWLRQVTVCLVTDLDRQGTLRFRNSSGVWGIRVELKE